MQAFLLVEEFIVNITFVIPGNNCSGGVRVTVCMANQLLMRGHRVRIAAPRPRPFTFAGLRELLTPSQHRNAAEWQAGWLCGFKGSPERFGDLDDLKFETDEIVVAVGTYTIQHVFNLRQSVLKVRFNHGLLDNMSESEFAAWKAPMPTITVASTIVPDLERITEQSTLAVVPNGIDLEEYRRVSGVYRDGIGSIFGLHPAKAPEILIHIFNRLQDTFPAVPRYAFGTEKPSSKLSSSFYWRYPSVEQARLIYNRARIWLVASHTEGFALPILEAMACGCVVISTDTYGGRELIRDGENGILVARGDVDGFLRSIARILENPELESRLAATGLETAADFTWGRASEKMESFLSQHSHRMTAERTI